MPTVSVGMRPPSDIGGQGGIVSLLQESLELLRHIEGSMDSLEDRLVPVFREEVVPGEVAQPQPRTESSGLAQMAILLNERLATLDTRVRRIEKKVEL